MSARGVILIVAVMGFYASLFAQWQVIALMTDQVNIDRPGKPPLWPYGGRAGWAYFELLRTITREYRAAHPDGKLYDRLIMSYVGLSVSILVALCSLYGLLGQ